MAIAIEKKMDNKQRHLAIFTTASLPWLTGTAVNPLFRAAYLAKEDQKRKVTLVIPWLSLKDQHLVFPDNITFNTPAEQEKFVREWLEARAGFTSSFTIRFYPGKFSLEKRSILALGDITVIIPNEEADIAVLEEPEHLTWYHHGKRWKKKFNLVIGVVHTNYLEYVRREKNAVEAFIVKQVNSWVISIYCNKVIRLSAATQDLPRSIICNVHGVNPKFLKIGFAKKEQQQQNNGDNNKAFTKSAYYIGKMLWSKGYKELLKLLSDNQKKLNGLEVDLYGSGEDSDQVQQTANKLDLTVRVHPGKDHADPLFHDYKVFLNPSTTDVVCTTTAEALAMGKIVVCANHPSNDFFKQFPNCRVYNDADGFVEATLNALKDEPAPLTDNQRHELSWEAATQRFLKSANLDNNDDDEHDDVKTMTTPSVKNLKKAPSKKLFASSSSSSSLNFSKSLEDASALMHFVGTTFLNEPPDEDQCKQLGLSLSSKKFSLSESLKKP